MRQFVKCMVSSNSRDVFRSSVYFLTSKALAKPHQNTSQVGSTVLHINRFFECQSLYIDLPIFLDISGYRISCIKLSHTRYTRTGAPLIFAAGSQNKQTTSFRKPKYRSIEVKKTLPKNSMLLLRLNEK